MMPSAPIKKKDEHFMKRALQLAGLSHNEIKTNPNVGAVIVYNQRIIGEGRYEQFGGSHAEVNAINSVSNDDQSLIAQSTIYVTLEPCCYYGKTPPCTRAIMNAGIKRVVISYIDPNPKIAGQGIAILKDAGIEVESGILEEEGKQMVEPFLCHLKQKPYIILKWAKSKNHVMGLTGHRTQISDSLSSIMTHTLRSRVDGILIGSTTAIVDNPSLTTRIISGTSPTRIIIDANLRVPTDSVVFDNQADTIIINQVKEDNSAAGITYLKVNDTKDMEAVQEKLYQAGMHRILVEGGKKILTTYISNRLWNKAFIITNQKDINQDDHKVKAPNLIGRLVDTFVMDKDDIKVVIP